MPDRDLTYWNVMLMGFAQLGLVDKTAIVLSQMRLDGICPDSVTIMALTQLGSSLEDLMLVNAIHCLEIQMGIEGDVSVANTWVFVYAKCGDLGMAEMVFGWIDPGLRTMFLGILCSQDMPILKNQLRRLACINGWFVMEFGRTYAEKGDLDEALALFRSMEAAGQKPDIVTLLYMISCCGQTGSLEVRRWIDNYATSNGKKQNVTVCNALIDMYAKCGNIRDAWELFSTMQGKTVVSWTSMISGYALNGEFKEALDIFCLMLELGLKPNHITFVAVLQACTHAGWLEKARELFDMMTKVHKINPGLGHYSCMTDLLGRMGKLKEALEFFEKMPFKLDAGIWGALLSACKNYHNVEIGEYATHRLFELEPEAAAPYIEMANLYASAGRWDGVARIRKLMKGIK
ncbi:hypothetical protein Vadar_006680 [Vaccinium darrowii]|uniref:Uncharacterized protein n=1 Tax=Vaccinium darrowii TaxID=229202 RepID=A0ACB7Z307_9ERIC|nr:hypothetical protein Vadar_006680 [Vaccinium darrowii]